MVKSPRVDDARSELLLVLKSGETLFKEGEAGSEMFIIEDGTVEILKIAGGREKRLALLEEGDFFGEMSVIEDLPRSATARAASDCRLLPIDASTFDQVLREHPEITIRIMRKLSSRLRTHEEASQRAREVAAGVLAGSASDALDSISREIESLPLPVATPPPNPPEHSDISSEPVTPASARARLVHLASAIEYALGGDRISIIGRFDPVTELAPEIDLEEIDTKRSLSRRHARIFEKDGDFFVREEIGTANGTFVRGERLVPGMERQIEDGDLLRLGLVELVFRSGEKS